MIKNGLFFALSLIFKEAIWINYPHMYDLQESYAFQLLQF